MNTPLIDIILPVYNGGKYLYKQVESIINQTYTNTRIIIRNDGSSDNSEFVLNRIKEEFKDRVQIIEDNLGNVGVIKSIEILLKHTTASYIMFCDQDDIWLNFKISHTLDAMLKLESKFPNLPLLICTDVTCVDGNGEKILHQSFFKSRKFTLEALKNDNTFLAMNIVQGCTMMINTKSLPYIIPIPSQYGHDAYIGAVINHFGKIYYLQEQTMLYRQHSSNVYGAPQIGIKYFHKKLINIFSILLECQRNFNQLPFKTSKWKWIVYKIYFSLKRCIS